jgi:ankyrin repeat protein
MEHGAQLCMEESQAASILCQAVFDGNILLLRSLLHAGIQVNAADYDKRTAVHIAAAEGNTAALKLLVEHDADLTAKDRWNNTVDDEAKREGAAKVLNYLKERKDSMA